MAAIEYNATYLGQATTDALQRVLDMRVKELGETSKQAAVALMINVLKSLRGNTMVANTRADNIIVTDVTSQLTPSFVAEGPKHRRVLRSGNNGKVIDKPDHYVIWDTTRYRKKESYRTFLVEDKVAADASYLYYVVAKNENAAQKVVKQVHAKRVKKHAKLAKYALGIAMNRVNSAQRVSDGVNPNIARTGMKSIVASVNDTGYDSGEVSIYVHDTLRYAAKALKAGDAYVEQAVQKALNKMTGDLIQKMKKQGKVTDSIKVPFQELVGL